MFFMGNVLTCGCKTNTCKSCEASGKGSVCGFSERQKNWSTICLKKNDKATLDLCPVYAQNKCCSVRSPWRTPRFSQGIGSPERCWLSFKSWEEPPPSLHLLGDVVPRISAILLVTWASFFLLLTFLHGVKGLTCSAWEGRMRLNYLIRGSAPPLRSLACSQKRPFVLRHRPVSRCAVAWRRWALMFTCCIAV